MSPSNSNGSKRRSRRGRKPVLTEAQRRAVPRLVRERVKAELRRVDRTT